MINEGPVALVGMGGPLGSMDYFKLKAMELASSLVNTFRAEKIAHEAIHRDAYLDTEGTPELTPEEEECYGSILHFLKSQFDKMSIEAPHTEEKAS